MLICLFLSCSQISSLEKSLNQIEPLVQYVWRCLMTTRRMLKEWHSRCHNGTCIRSQIFSDLFWGRHCLWYRCVFVQQIHINKPIYIYTVYNMYRYVVICIMLTCYRWFIRNPCGCALNQMHKRLDLGHVISMTPIRWSLGSSDCPAQKWLFCPKIEVWSSTRPIHTRLFIPQRSWSYLRLYHLSTIFTYPKKNI